MNEPKVLVSREEYEELKLLRTFLERRVEDALNLVCGVAEHAAKNGKVGLRGNDAEQVLDALSVIRTYRVVFLKHGRKNAVHPQG
jgi:hypothetical protein